ncbi:hypothetical protein Tco_0803493 [Tanacetum coccineum]|uniref:Zinc finger, CCHC-type n=1 Tax=Tanacetum coccineum TaxID=301880 RepID=A0ABQ5A1Q2_9ASTR
MVLVLLVQLDILEKQGDNNGETEEGFFRLDCILKESTEYLLNPTADVAIPKDEEEEEYNEDRRFLIPLYVFGARDIYGPDSPLPPTINAALTLLRHLALRCLPRWSDPSVNRWEQVKLNYLEQPLPPAHVASAGQQFAPQILAAHTAWVKGSKEIDGLMLMIMEPEIQRNLGKSPC